MSSSVSVYESQVVTSALPQPVTDLLQNIQGLSGTLSIIAMRAFRLWRPVFCRSWRPLRRGSGRPNRIYQRSRRPESSRAIMFRCSADLHSVILVVRVAGVLTDMIFVKRQLFKWPLKSSSYDRISRVFQVFD
ncbi:hypothetical protein BC936DRAFT_136870 [Jimgerdemannia flammicorona]|uniref:Uncharacterized protein n=1 Tax=Jimgerdemannia flammicorona TaxID=994334 RepID=A0A433CYM9_9FUNG|nr:hypothetical protein BC936DRAFT_136870 [Jimgerdemannia flammicorona]